MHLSYMSTVALGVQNSCSPGATSIQPPSGFDSLVTAFSGDVLSAHVFQLLDLLMTCGDLGQQLDLELALRY